MEEAAKGLRVFQNAFLLFIYLVVFAGKVETQSKCLKCFSYCGAQRNVIESLGEKTTFVCSVDSY